IGEVGGGWSAPGEGLVVVAAGGFEVGLEGGFGVGGGRVDVVHGWLRRASGCSRLVDVEASRASGGGVAKPGRQQWECSVFSRWSVVWLAVGKMAGWGSRGSCIT